MKREKSVIQRIAVIASLIFLSFTSQKSTVSSYLSAADTVGVFTCVVDDKPLVIKGFKAYMRTVTGGYKQLSLSNDRFNKFCLIKPTTKQIQLENISSREAVIYYTDPVNLNQYKPLRGYLNIKVLDEDKKIISGDFEMEMSSKTNPSKKIKIKQGKLINIPIVYLTEE